MPIRLTAVEAQQLGLIDCVTQNVTQEMQRLMDSIQQGPPNCLQQLLTWMKQPESLENMHLNILGLLMTPLGLVLKDPVESVSPTEDYHPLRAIVDDAEPMTLNDMGQGAIVDGVYIDSTKLFSVSVPEDWSVVPGSQFGELRVIVQHSIDDYSVQIWKVNGTHYRPTVREDCVWSFVDKGLYTVGQCLDPQVWLHVSQVNQQRI